ncbi:MAG: methyl-accepting chemotaxis protein [Planctomycetota bacterium]
MIDSRNVERNLKIIALLGASIFATLLGVAFAMQRTLGQSIQNLASDVVPLQTELARLGDSISAVFLSQSDLATLEIETLRHRQADQVDVTAMLESVRKLERRLASIQPKSNGKISNELVEVIKTDASRFLDSRSRVFEAAIQHRIHKTEFRDLELEFVKSADALQSQAEQLLGRIQLDLTIKRRNVVGQGAKDVGTVPAEELVFDPGRKQVETIQSFVSAAQRLELLAEKIALADGVDQLNSIVANELAQSAQDVSLSLRRLNRSLGSEARRKKSQQIEALTKQLLRKIAVKDDPLCLVERRRQIIEDNHRLIEEQSEARQIANTLLDDASDLMVAAENYATATRSEAQASMDSIRFWMLIGSAVGVIAILFSGLRLRSSIKTLRTQNDSLESSVMERTAEVDSQRKSIENVLGSVSHNAEDVSTNASQMSANAREMQCAVREIDSAIKEIEFNIAQVVKKSNSAVGATSDANAKIGQLSEASEKINAIVREINSIAEQTNLLALNATIEAARAGEYGKGFVVVANEVKELAKQSSTAADGIIQLLEDVRTQTSSTQRTIGNVSMLVNDVNESQIAIATAVEEQSAVLSGISANAGLVSNSVMEVAESVAGIAKLAREQV